LGNVENDSAELDEAMKKQKRAKLAKSRTTDERSTRVTKPEALAEPDAEVENAIDAESESTAEEKADAPFDSSMGLKSLSEGDSDQALNEGSDDSSKPHTQATTWLVIAAIVAITAALVMTFLPQVKSLFIQQESESTSTGSPQRIHASPVDARLPRVELSPTPVSANPAISAVAFPFAVPSLAAPVSPFIRLCTLTHAAGHGSFADCKLMWLAENSEGLQPAIILLRKGNRIDVAVSCEPAISKSGFLTVGAMMIDKNDVVWRWTYPGEWSEKMQRAWLLILPTLAQSVVEVQEPSGTTIAKIQLIMPLTRSMQQHTSTVILDGLQPAGPVSLSMAALPAGWRANDDADADKPLELTHSSGAKVTLKAIVTKSGWTISADWPADSQVEKLVAAIAQQEQEISQLLTYKTSPAAIAETQGDVDRLTDELERMTAQIAQAKSRLPAEPGTIASLETHRNELSTSLLQLQDKLGKMKSAPATIDTLRAQRKACSDRLEAVKEVTLNPLIVSLRTSRAILAVANLVNSSPGPDNAPVTPVP
jgi:hypothetical protein